MSHDTVLNLVNTLSGYVGIALIFALVGTGVYFTIRLNFVQIRKFRQGMKLVFGNFTLKGEAAGDKGMSSFQALATTIAAQVGTGNIAGAATAIAAGGPGAIFWMWVAAFFGMATNYAEATLAQETRTEIDGQIIGGPVYYIKAAFKGTFGKVLAAIFSVLCILTIGFVGSMAQMNSMGDSIRNALGVPPIVLGIIMAIALYLIYRGGIKNIVAVTEKMVPIMAISYIIISLIVIAMNYQNIIPAFKSIFVGAFFPDSVMGGALGITVRQAIQYGVQRGLFSNEAGVGTTPHAHALAKVRHSCDQGTVAIITVFIDTFIVLNMTALVILTTGVFDGTTTGMTLAQNGFNHAFGALGPILVFICLFFFAFSTLLGTYFFGAQNVKYLFGMKAIPTYRIIVCILIVLGSTLSVNLMWALNDLFNSLMAFPNLLGCIGLSALVIKKSQEHDKLPKFDSVNAEKKG
nr:amino acid carrier protein [Anaerotruncus rubiinfantis]